MFVLEHELADIVVVVTPTFAPRGPAQSMRPFKKNLRMLKALQHNLLFRRKVRVHHGRLARQLRCTPISMILCHPGMMKGVSLHWEGTMLFRMKHIVRWWRVSEFGWTRHFRFLLFNVSSIQSVLPSYLLIFRLQLSILRITLRGWRPCLRSLFRIMALSRLSFALAGFALVKIRDLLRILSFDLSNTLHLWRPHRHLPIMRTRDAQLQPKSKQMTRASFVLPIFQLHVHQIQIAWFPPLNIRVARAGPGWAQMREGPLWVWIREME